ncbi:metallophosphoesterase family protein [Agreia sp. Leaf210]|uniref:metallophosphoesterase family protein n=1 Tax=Agreia sp. Leaf210 TaxID=1735682 RepID=UPI0009EBDB92|nr:metallophosphoesterase [Agreia sp. Leaf210]
MTKLAIISDIHAFHPDAGAIPFGDRDPSWTRTLPGRAEESRGPFQSLEVLIREEQLQADYVLCAGDMGNGADHQGIVFAWSWLQNIRNRLTAKWLIGTTGNHDVDSRNLNKWSDPTLSTRTLQPPFPMDDPDVRRDYWKDNVALHSTPELDIVILNTAAGHDDEKLAKRGLVSPDTLEKLKELVSRANNPRKVLLAHHHPYRHDAIDIGDYSALDAGPEVLKILQDDGCWMVIHGHRHYPNLVYAAGGAQAPVIMAAGSFSARLYPELATRVRNQFHLVDLKDFDSVPGTSGQAGIIRSWEYSISAGWSQPKSDEGIPDQAGFGYRDDIAKASSLVEAYVKGSPERFLPLEDIFTTHPELRYMLPADRRGMLDSLSASGTIQISQSQHYSLHPSEIFLGSM